MSAPPLSADFTFSPLSPVIGEAVTFTATASGGTFPYSFSWDFGDAQSGTGETTNHAFASAETFPVTLNVTDANNDFVLVTHSVPVTPPLTADFSFSPSKPVVGESVTFTATASGGTPQYTYAWTFGDDSGGNGATTSHAYATSGTFTVTLTVSDSASHVASVPKSVPVTPPLTADFTFSPNQPDAGETVSFSGTAAGGTSPYVYGWTFGDGGTAAGPAVSHAFASAGSYPVTLTVSDAASHVATATKSIPIAPVLTADFTFSPAKPVIGETVSFSGTASGGTPPYAYAWDFSDGSSATGPTAAHAFTSAGTFTVTLTVSDSAGHSTPIAKSVFVSADMAGDFTFSPIKPATDETVSFSATASGGTPPYAYGWDFGDGSTGAGATVSHAYALEGSFPVTLQVSDSAGHVATVMKSILVTPPLSGDFTISPSLPLAFEPVTFSATAAGGTLPYAYAWDFGDGSSATGPSASHIYAAAGSFDATLTLSDSAGHVVTVTHTLVVSLLLAADFTLSQTFPVLGEVVSFSATARGANPPYTYAWDFGDGSTASGATAEHAYASAGAFAVTLTVVDSAGHVAIVAKPIVATPPLAADLAFSPQKPEVGETISFVGLPGGATPPYTLNWTFGDGSNDTGTETSHAYNSSGTFRVILTVFDSAGHTATDSVSIPITASLVANFTFLPIAPVDHEAIDFSANASGGTPPYTYAWNFGDGSIGADLLVTYAYDRAKTFDVTLTVSDAVGHVVVVSRTISIGPALAADFTFSPERPVTGRAIFFSANASGGAPPYTYHWDFGDGESSEGAETNHTYGGFGPSVTYLVVLTVCDAAGRCTPVSHNIAFENLFLVVMLVLGALFATVIAAWYLARRRRVRTEE